MKIETTVWKKIFALLMVLPIRGKKGYEEDSRESTKSEERGNKSSLFPIAFPRLVPWEDGCSRILRLTLWLGFHVHPVTF